MSEVQARLRAALVAIAEEDVTALYEKTIEDAIATLDDGIRPEEDAQGTVSGACAAVGRLDLLVEARALGYPWNAKTCVKAAKYGHLGVFEVRARARVSLGQEDVQLCRLRMDIWSV
jgi:hypothetical protein